MFSEYIKTVINGLKVWVLDLLHGVEANTDAKFNGMLFNVEKAISDVNGSADNAKETADNAQKTADNAQETANSALSVANSASNTAGTVNNRTNRLFSTLVSMPHESIRFTLDDPSTYVTTVTSGSVEYAEIGDISNELRCSNLVYINYDASYDGNFFSVVNGVAKCVQCGIVVVQYYGASNNGVFNKGKVYMVKSKIKAGKILRLNFADPNPIHDTHYQPLQMMSDSGKVFKITVDDTGTISATEVTS